MPTETPRTVRALRGATTLDVDDEPHMVERVSTLLTEMLDRNQVDHDDLVSIVFTATDDIHSAFPALAARRMGLGDVPLLCARELEIDGATPRCVRVLMHLMTSRSRSEMRHVYLESARGLRDDLPE
ncbi:MAG: chorismate mutase [Microthrixaceae bacterium]|mgnify:CR=1 FL=1|nr:chorismate mutase [Microthrixaceae bacterium]MCB1011651.1 chorismate mutase [Microthrixaceae bacterium]MCB9386571.1 chorismate mutase [Microthrixaceae bacterium]MCO5320060.1 chorismate mutase [Microthrixaceae bacterium]